MDIDVDSIISRLLEVRGRPGKQVNLSEMEIRGLCMKAREIFISQPILLELEAPIKICGTLEFFFLSFSSRHEKKSMRISLLMKKYFQR